MKPYRIRESYHPVVPGETPVVAFVGAANAADALALFIKNYGENGTRELSIDRQSEPFLYGSLFGTMEKTSD